MKRIFACILSVILMMSILPSLPVVASEGDSFAESIAVPSVGYEGQLNGSGERYLQFTTSATSAFYTLYLQNNSDSRISYVAYNDSSGTTGFFTGYADARTSKSEDLGKLTANKTYYIKLSGTANSQFRLIFVERDDDVGDDGLSALGISLGKTYEYTLQDLYDTDCFSFKTTGKDSFYWLNLENHSNNDVISVAVYDDIYCSNIVESFYQSGRSGKTISLNKLSKNKTYYVKVSVSDYAISNRIREAQYAITVVEKKDDVADTCKKAKKINLVQKVNAKLQDENDVDCFCFKTTKNKLDYAVEINNVANAALTVYVYDNKDEVNYVAYDYVYQKKSLRLTIDGASKNKTYYVKVFLKPYAGGNVGKYSVIVKPLPRGTKAGTAKVSGQNGALKVSAKAAGVVSGFQVRYKPLASKSKYVVKSYNAKKGAIKNKKIKGLAGNASYMVSVRTWYKYKGKKYYSDWEGLNGSGYDYTNVFVK